MSDNQFTREDLQRISYIVDKYLQWAGEKDELKIIDKLDKLIANYCDHDFKHSYREIEHEYCTICGLQTV